MGWEVYRTIDTQYSNIQFIRTFAAIQNMSHSRRQIPSNLRFQTRYLAVHAACAKIAHMSGAATYVDKFYPNMEDRMILDLNGASAKLLEKYYFCATDIRI